MPDFSVVSHARMRSNGHDLNHERFHVNMRKNFCAFRMGRGCWGRLGSLPFWSHFILAWMRSCVTCSRLLASGFYLGRGLDWMASRGQFRACGSPVLLAGTREVCPFAERRWQRQSRALCCRSRAGGTPLRRLFAAGRRGRAPPLGCALPAPGRAPGAPAPPAPLPRGPSRARRAAGPAAAANRIYPAHGAGRNPAGSAPVRPRCKQ